LNAVLIATLPAFTILPIRPRKPDIVFFTKPNNLPTRWIARPAAPSPLKKSLILFNVLPKKDSSENKLDNDLKSLDSVIAFLILANVSVTKIPNLLLAIRCHTPLKNPRILCASFDSAIAL
jgi:hypothetical protein